MTERFSVHSPISDVQLTIGMRVVVHLDDDGMFAGFVDHFEDDNAVAVIVATRDPVRDVFPKGYRIGQAHWKTSLTLIAEDAHWPEVKW